MPVTLEPVPACYFCGGELAPPLFATAYTDLWPNPEGHRYAYRPCPTCAVILLADRPRFGPELADFYARRGGCSFLDPAHPNALVRAYTRGLQRRKLALLQQLVPLGPGSRVLEVGCARGAFAVALAEAVGCEVHANDLDPAMGERLPASVRFHPGPFGAHLDPDGFDAIVSHQVIEHVYDPAQFLRDCHALLKPGGTLVLETINHDCATFRTFGENWAQLCAPRHTVLFSAAFFERRLAAIAPFTDVQVRYDGYATHFSTLVGSVLHALHLPLAESALARGAGAGMYLALNPWISAIERATGAGRSIITVAARRPVATAATAARG